ncbi:hypothetical protein [Pseudoxanthomonas sacheonensis]|uniref:Pectate lyase superfamily protein n=1 Tax=Pseudoxanthomonas sacheonensis TaxID=443615 RepID=A0ABU1RWC2_9GAMM|nr:hypothetical protein [Pseudoxanthomonas sacheonensis]MDR6842195.1 hypothetical protein [Pseudoxanthomonas sacheonensis]
MSDDTLRGDLANGSDSEKGAALVAFKLTDVGALARTVADKLNDTLCVLDFIPSTQHAAILAGTSTYDATADVQAAINAAIAARRKLYAPGHYRLTAKVNVTGALTLYGDGNEMQVGWLGDVQTRGKGSWFFLDHTGVGFFINDSVHRTGVIFDGIGTYRTQPATTDGSFTPIAHGWDIEAKNCDLLLRDISLYNPTKGLLCWGGTRLSIERLRGEPLSVGIEINDAGDTCRIRDVHFWPFFSNSPSVRTQLRANAKAIVLRDVDNPDLCGIFTLGYADGVVCEPIAGTLAMPLKVRLSNFDFDNGGYGFRVASGGANGVTAILTHGYILGVSVGGPANASNIDIGGNNNAIMIDNVGMDLPQDCNVKVSGTGNVVRGANWSVGRWNFDAGTSFGIEVAAGNTLRLANPPIITQAGMTTLVFGGAGTISCPLGSGVTTSNTSATGYITITHGLGIAPRVISMTCQFGTAYHPRPTTTRNAATFDLQVRDNTGTAVANTSVTVEWIAFY